MSAPFTRVKVPSATFCSVNCSQTVSNVQMLLVEIYSKVAKALSKVMSFGFFTGFFYLFTELLRCIKSVPIRTKVNK